MINIKPDIIIPYMNTDTTGLPVAVCYVRPRTNKIKYEKSIILGLQPFADVIYLANLNGNLFIKNALILEHYSTQYKFAIFGKREICKYDEMVEQFETHFNTSFETADIIGSFDAILEMGINTEELFNMIVDNKDFLRFYGQTIKKIRGRYIINYNIPEILRRYTPDANVFVIAARLKKKDINLQEIDHSIFEKIQADDQINIVDEEKFKQHEWFEKVRRTYHISRNYLAGIFDMMDYIFKIDGTRVKLPEIPMAQNLIENNIITQKKLLKIKDYTLVHIKDQNGKRKLINIYEEALNLTADQCVDLLKHIIWEDEEEPEEVVEI